MAMHNENCGNSLILALETSGRMGSVAIAQEKQLLGESAFSGPMRHSAEVFPAIVDLLGQFGKKPNQIEQVYISAGPGSFTGLRIAVTIAKTMALANGAKIVAIDTLDCIAANVINLTATESSPKLKTQNSKLKTNERLAVILDAKRSQFFIAVYEQSAQNDLSLRAQRSNLNQLNTQYSTLNTDFPLTKILPDCLMTADEFIDRFTDKPTCGERSRTIALIGEGLVFYKDKFAHKNIRVLDEKFWNPSAANVYRLGWEMAKQNQFVDPLTLSPNYLRGALDL
jgi:tRNA threonylcarbamoyl adenosine modification protein YeaZ